MLTIDPLMNITLTRGDTAFFDVTVGHKDGTPYELQVEDRVVFRLRSNKTYLEKELSIDAEENVATLELEPEDTQNLMFAAYRYEIELITSEDEHYTFIADKSFTIGKELEDHNGD